MKIISASRMGIADGSYLWHRWSRWNHHMKMSWHQSSFLIIGPLWRESCAKWAVMQTFQCILKGQWWGRLAFSLWLSWTDSWTKRRIAHDSRRCNVEFKFNNLNLNSRPSQCCQFEMSTKKFWNCLKTHTVKIMWTYGLAFVLTIKRGILI